MSSVREETDSVDPEINLVDEVNFIKQDVEFAVEKIFLSEKILRSEGSIFINIQTKEMDKFCVELSKAGFRVKVLKFILYFQIAKMHGGSERFLSLIFCIYKE